MFICFIFPVTVSIKEHWHGKGELTWEKGRQKMQVND